MAVYGGPEIVTDGLVLHLDAANSKSYPGSGSTWYDLSGNGNNGTLTNGPTFSSSNGGSIVFDGTNDYVDCGNNNSINITGNYLTLSAWIDHNVSNSATTLRSIISKSNQFGMAVWFFYNGDPGWERELLGITYFDSSAIYYQLRNYGYLENANRFYYISCVKNGASNISIYQDGILLVTKSLGSTLVSTNSNLTIGSPEYPGNISQVSVYNRALTSNEISQNYKATKGRYGL